MIAAMVLGLRRIAGAVGRRAKPDRPASASTPSEDLRFASPAAGRPSSTTPQRLGRLLSWLVVLVALVATFTVGPLSGARPGWGRALTPAHRAVIAEALTMVPADASVSADNALGAHLSARERITTFPLLSDADYVVLDSQGRYGPWRARELKKLRRDEHYRLVFDREGVLVFKRVR